MVSKNERTRQPEDVDDEDMLDDDGDDFDPKEYDTMLQLERLESLEEEMMEMSVATLEDVRQRIADIHRLLDEEERGR